MSIVYRIALGCWVLSCLSLSSAFAQKPDEDALELLQNIQSAFSSAFPLTAEFDIFETKNGVRTLQVSGTEAFAKGTSYGKAIHWYDKRFCNVEDESHDELLNTYLWQKGKGRWRIFNNTGKVSHSKGDSKFIEIPLIQRYFGYVGILTPERVVHPGKEAILAGEDWQTKDYYFPWCLDNKAEWKVEFSKDLIGATLVRRNGVFEDRIKATVSPVKILSRKISFLDDGFTLFITSSDFQPVTEELSLPKSVHVELDKSEFNFVVKKLSRSWPMQKSFAKWPPGFFVVSKESDEKITIKGGEELLDKAIGRMERATAYWDQGDNLTLLSFGQLLCVVFAVITIFRIRARMPKEDTKKLFEQGGSHES